MSTKHTPEPWKVEGQNIIGYSEAHIAVAKVLSNVGQPAKANAFLIASSPDLLSACESALIEITHIYHRSDYLPDVVNQLEQVIAKAKGGK